MALIVLNYDFSLIALIGLILLVGIVKKNAIMMIDFALDGERRRNLSPTRCRPFAALSAACHRVTVQRSDRLPLAKCRPVYPIGL